MIKIVFIGLRSTSDNSVNVVQLIYEINYTVVKLAANCRDFLTVHQQLQLQSKFYGYLNEVKGESYSASLFLNKTTQSRVPI